MVSINSKRWSRCVWRNWCLSYENN